MQTSATTPSTSATTKDVRDVVPVIPMRKTWKLRVAVDRRLDRPRNRVERCFNKLKNARRVASRY